MDKAPSDKSYLIARPDYTSPAPVIFKREGYTIKHCLLRHLSTSLSATSLILHYFLEDCETLTSTDKKKCIWRGGFLKDISHLNPPHPASHEHSQLLARVVFMHLLNDNTTLMEPICYFEPSPYKFVYAIWIQDNI
jgi:hypothetical protein